MRDFVERKLKLIDSLEVFEKFNIDDEIISYQSLIVQEGVAKGGIGSQLIQDDLELIEVAEINQPKIKKKELKPLKLRNILNAH